MHLEDIVFDGTDNTSRTTDGVIKILEYFHPIVYPKPIIRGNKMKRNDSCYCGSDKKFKKCCINKENK
mgnify:CR=1 FL=1|jgi:uncharacterized protein YchJ|tara:strand:- start:93 stop:296 length:204 start_codon:yes stop_codon:yes gene_type:complete